MQVLQRVVVDDQSGSWWNRPPFEPVLIFYGKFDQRLRIFQDIINHGVLPSVGKRVKADFGMRIQANG